MFINADAAGLMKTFNQVDRRMARWSSSLTKPGAKLALGFLGVQNALTAVSSEVRYVIDNIENIKGVNPEAAASIITLRDNLSSAKDFIHQMTAGIIGFGVQAGQAIGVGAAALMGYHDTSGLSKGEGVDDIARAKNPNYDKEVESARKKMIEASKAAALAIQDEAGQIKTLRKEAAEFATFSAAKTTDKLASINAQTAAQERLTKANEKMRALQKELESAEKKSGEAFGDVIGASMADKETRMADLLKGQSVIQRKLIDLKKGDQDDPDNIKKQIDLREQLTRTYERQIPLLEKQKALALEVGTTIASSFENAVFSGAKFSDTLRGIAMDLARMLFRNSITSPLAAGIGSWFSSIMGKPAAAGGYRDGSKPYLVGENGPEIFAPGSAGTIIPNNRLGGGGSSGGGDTIVVNQSYNIGAGVTASQLMPILAMQKRAILGTIADARRRRTSLGAALA